MTTDIYSAGVVILEMTFGKYPFSATSEDGILESVLNVLGPISVEQMGDIGVDSTKFSQLMVGSACSTRRWSDAEAFPQTLSRELRSLLNKALEYSPRRREDAATLLNHDFFNIDPTYT